MPRCGSHFLSEVDAVVFPETVIGWLVPFSIQERGRRVVLCYRDGIADFPVSRVLVVLFRFPLARDEVHASWAVPIDEVLFRGLRPNSGQKLYETMTDRVE